MKSMCINLILLTLFATVTSFHAMEKESWSSRVYEKASNVAAKAKQKIYSSRLFAGYHSTSVQKEVALEKIRELLFEKDQLQDLINNSEISTKDKQNTKKRIVQIDHEVHTQKIITGDKWSKTRKLVVGTGLAAVGAGAAALYSKDDSVIYTPTSLPYSVYNKVLSDNGYTIKMPIMLAPVDSLYMTLGAPQFPSGGYIWTYFGRDGYYHDLEEGSKQDVTRSDDPAFLTLRKNKYIKGEYALFRSDDVSTYKGRVVIRYDVTARRVTFPSIGSEEDIVK